MPRRGLFGVTSIRIERRGGVAGSVPQAPPALVSSGAECYPIRCDRQDCRSRPGGNMNRQWMLIALLGTMAAAQAADAYRWVDANGVVHYSDAPPPVEFKAELVHLPGTGTKAGTAGAAGALPDEPAKADDSEEPGEKKPPGVLASSVQLS